LAWEITIGAAGVICQTYSQREQFPHHDPPILAGAVTDGPVPAQAGGRVQSARQATDTLLHYLHGSAHSSVQTPRITLRIRGGRATSAEFAGIGYLVVEAALPRRGAHGPRGPTRRPGHTRTGQSWPASSTRWIRTKPDPVPPLSSRNRAKGGGRAAAGVAQSCPPPTTREHDCLRSLSPATSHAGRSSQRRRRDTEDELHTQPINGTIAP